MKTYTVTYFDETTGGVGEMNVRAATIDAAIERVELAGEYEVIHVEYVD